MSPQLKKVMQVSDATRVTREHLDLHQETSLPGAFVDEAECLRRVPISRSTWFTWRRAGKIPAIKLGRRILYHWISVEAALLRMQRGGAE